MELVNIELEELTQLIEERDMLDEKMDALTKVVNKFIVDNEIEDEFYSLLESEQVNFDLYRLNY